MRFELVPPSSTAWVVTLSIVVVCLALLLLFAYIAYSMRNVTVEVENDGLRIKGSLYGRFIPKEQIIKNGIRTLDLSVKSEYKPRIRTNGIGLPGYKEGWFKLRNGKKALLFVTSNTVVYVPTNNFAVMLSVKNPEIFVETLKTL
ncbi:PH domain-containing protein [Candidatus Alkanophaga liquidiphilum]